MRILGIETSCDETAVSVIETSDKRQGTNGMKVLSNIISSQVKLHAKYGGVVPNLAAREHVKNIGHVFKLAIKKADIKNLGREIDLITVTRGPGLGPALLVGITFARTLAWKYNKPIIGVNHLEGHIYSNWLKSVGIDSAIRSFSELGPILNLIVSGGHTELVLMKSHGKYRVIGETLDDAVGEAFDKVARLLDLGYPGGPLISKLAEKGDPSIYPLPSPMINSKNYDFSYSGLKTAVLYLLRDLVSNPSSSLGQLSAKQKCDIAASFQKSACEVLIKKTLLAAKECGVKSIMLSGGVSANKYLRTELEKSCKASGFNYSQPEIEYTGDNAAMIALAGYFSAKGGSAVRLSSPSKSSGGNYSKKDETKELSWNSVEMDANLGF